MLMPSLFISHGSPTTMIEEDSAGRLFLSTLGATLERPKAIVVISAHWENTVPTTTTVPHPETIHDFYGFPEELYQIQYKPLGAPDLARRIAKMLGGKTDDTRGLDHGAWAPLSLIYPDADIPVIQLSLQADKSPAYHYAIGQQLAPLRKEGVLIMASGAATHNLKELRWFSNEPESWAVEFEDWFVHALQANDHDGLLNAHKSAPHFSRAHPRDEHWLPLYVALGAASKSASLLHRGFEHKNLSMASARFD